MRTVTIQLADAQAVDIRNANPLAGTIDQRDPRHEDYDPSKTLRADVPATQEEMNVAVRSGLDSMTDQIDRLQEEVEKLSAERAEWEPERSVLQEQLAQQLHEVGANEPEVPA